MAKDKKKIGVTIGYISIVILFLSIAGMAASVWAKPYTSIHDTVKATVEAVDDNTKTLVVTENAQCVLAASEHVDTLAINAVFLQKMREKGELLSADEFASRITDYYNTLVAVLTALFVLFTIVTYMTIRSKFDGKFEEKASEFEHKARDLEEKQRQKIIDELRSMLSDSKKIDEVIQSAVGGRVEDTVPTKEEVDDLTSDLETCGKNIACLSTGLTDIKKKQQELFKVVAEIQEQVSKGAVVCSDALDTKEKEATVEETPNIPEAKATPMEGTTDKASNKTELNGNKG